MVAVVVAWLPCGGALAHQDAGRPAATRTPALRCGTLRAMPDPALAAQLAERRAERAAIRPASRHAPVPRSVPVSAPVSAPAAAPQPDPDLPWPGAPLAPGDLDRYLADTPGAVGREAAARVAAAGPAPVPDADAGLPLRERALRMTGELLTLLRAQIRGGSMDATEINAALDRCARIADVYAGAGAPGTGGAGQTLNVHVYTHAQKIQRIEKILELGKNRALVLRDD